jgi:prolyl oligopeptidase PreP (S9A serine peptidase family)
MSIFFQYGFDAGVNSEQAIETKSGHGSSNLSKVIEETSDVYAFLFKSMGFKPRVKGS